MWPSPSATWFISNQRPLPYRAVHASRHSRRVADGAALFFLWPQSGGDGSVQPATKAGLRPLSSSACCRGSPGSSCSSPPSFHCRRFLFGGFHLTRVWHFAAMCGLLAFVPGRQIMVLYGWSNFFSMLSGWKREPVYRENRNQTGVMGDGPLRLPLGQAAIRCGERKEVKGRSAARTC